MTGTDDRDGARDRLVVDIDEELVATLRARADAKGFDDVEAYAATLLEQVGRKLTLRQKRSGERDEDGKADEDVVRERLRDLGYVD
jgi:hypothetical protein